MADTKISDLPDSALPLSGAEIIPLDQSSTTKKVSVADLTAGRTVNATTFNSTNLEINHVKANDGTSSFYIENTTGNIGFGTAFPVDKIQLNTGNLRFNGTAQRIIGDFSNTVAANRLLIQSGTLNGNTLLELIPNGTATESSVRVNNNGTDPNNGSVFRLSCDATGARLISTRNGSGTYVPMTLHAGGTQRIEIGTIGTIGVNGSASTNVKFRVTGTTPFDFGNGTTIAAVETIPSTATGSVTSYLSSPTTQAASFTITDLFHFRANPVLPLGAGSAVTTQYGFNANTTLTAATTNFGFYSNIASAAGRFNFYAAGSADNVFLGSVGIGGLASANTKCAMGGTLPTSGTASIGFGQNATIPSGTTALYVGFNSSAPTEAASFTLSTYVHYRAFQPAFGAGSTVTGQYGYFVDSALTGATNNYGFYSNIPSGSGRWNFYASGTADNYFAGNTGVGGAALSVTRMFAKGSDATSGNWTYYGQNSAATEVFGVRNDGAFSTGQAASSPYNLITGSAANVYVDSSGFLYRSTSSLRYKSEIVNATHGLADVLKLRSVTYKAKNSGDTVLGGLIAEEVHDAGLTEFVVYDKENRPDALHYGNMVALAFKAIQELTARVAELETK
jgi:hypothetical protein